MWFLQGLKMRVELLEKYFEDVTGRNADCG